MVPLKIVSNVSRFKPALSLNQGLADLNRGSSSLNSISGCAILGLKFVAKTQVLYENLTGIWQISTILTIINHFDNYQPYWQILTISTILTNFNHFDNYQPYWQILTILTTINHIDNFQPFWQIHPSWQINLHYSFKGSKKQYKNFLRKYNFLDSVLVKYWHVQENILVFVRE